MASHPARPYEDEQRVGQRSSPPVAASHPATPFGTGAGTNPALSNPHGSWSRTGQQTPLGPTPTRVPQMTGEPGGPGFLDE
jgi:hypothetical protein